MAKNKISGYWRWLRNELSKTRKWYKSIKETLEGCGILLALLGSIFVPSTILIFAAYVLGFPLWLGAIIVSTSTVLTASYIRYRFERKSS
jgi:hypothetical protein